jgi:PAS domain S-box-containing protein
MALPSRLLCVPKTVKEPPFGRSTVMRNVADHEKAEEALQDSETRYRRLFETAQDGIVILNAETGMIVDVNPFLVEMLGFSHEQLAGKAIWEIGLFKDIVSNKDKFMELQRQEYVRYENLPLQTADGRQIDVEFVSNVYRVDHQKVIQCNIRDITDRKKAEEALRDSETRYRRLFETAKDGILILDATGKIVDVNPFLIKLLGFSHERLAGKAIWDIGPFKDIASNQDKFMELHRQGYARYEDLPIETADGRKIDVEFVSNIYTVDHQIVIQCNIRDITDRKKAEEALQDSETRYRRLFETAQDGILILNTNGEIVDVNPFLVKLLGLPYEKFLGRYIWDIGSFKDVASSKDRFTELQRQEYVRYDNLPLETADGRKIDVEFVSNVYRVDHQKVIQCNIRDITERKRAEREIEDKLRETIKMKLDFISVVSHELRTPLTVIKEGIALVANGSMGEINEEQGELLNLSRKNVDRLAKFINEVLDFQKLEAGRSTMNARPNDMNETVRDVCKMMALAAKDAGTDIVLELDDRLPLAGFDADKIAQVLTNLVDNAVKFTEKGHVAIKTSEKDGMIHVSVSDTGCGIREEDLSRSFRMFERLSTGSERRTGGTGLGLAICKGIIEQHNGKIWVDSVFGKGSVFTFTLPIHSLTELFREYIDDRIKEASTNNARMSLVLISIGNLHGLRQELSHDDITSPPKGMEAILAKNLHRRNGGSNQATDAVFSLPPNELFVVLTNCDKENAQVVKERLGEKLNEYLVDTHIADKITVSFECVTYPDDAATSEELIEKAEKARPVVPMALPV